MKLIKGILDIEQEMTTWRRHLHQYPETAFNEIRTAGFIVDRLTRFGLKVETGLAKTGVVGILKAGQSRKSIALRSDMDALFIKEANKFDYKSKNQGQMHACGHDGHMSMLLGAAQYLAQTRKFNGTVYFVFQPAEENEGGGQVMIKEGLFEKFPADSVYGMHNWPFLPMGYFAVKNGPILAAFDIFDIVVKGKGGHGALPHLCLDPIPAAAQIVSALQTIISRNMDPIKAGVISITQIHGGQAYNIVPDQVTLSGTTRSFSEDVQQMIEDRIRKTATAIAKGFGMKIRIDYQRRYPPTINDPNSCETAKQAAAKVVSAQNIIEQFDPSMGSEDFAFMLQKKPGCFVFLGTGEADTKSGLHNGRFDFNDKALPIGASYWVNLVETALPPT